MNNPDRLYEILKEGEKLGLLSPDRPESIALSRSINQANKILALFKEAGVNGLSCEQLADRSGLNITTARTFAKGLSDLKLLLNEKELSKTNQCKMLVYRYP